MLRISFFIGAAACFGSLAIAYFYMQLYLLLTPCPLCILDRIVVAAMGVVFLAMAFWTKWRRGLWVLNALFLSAGFLFAGRHVWLQNRPPDAAAECLPGEASTLLEIIERAFDANASCGAIYWEFAGLSIPAQVLLMFIGFAVLLLAQAAVIFRRAS